MSRLHCDLVQLRHSFWICVEVFMHHIWMLCKRVTWMLWNSGRDQRHSWALTIPCCVWWLTCISLCSSTLLNSSYMGKIIVLIDITIWAEDYLLIATNSFWPLNRYHYFQLNITHILICLTKFTLTWRLLGKIAIGPQ